MHRTITTLIATAFLAVVIVVASGQVPAQSRGVLSVLHAGQPVTLKETEGCFMVSVYDNGTEMLNHKVVEVGGDYLVVQDIVGMIETRIPIFSIKSVMTITLKKAK